MYDLVYNAMVDTNSDTPLEESEYWFINRSERLVKIEEEAVDHHINHHISHPQCVLFGDEVGTDTNQIDDGKMEVRVALA